VGALEAADLVLAAAESYRKGLAAELEVELAPFLDERGRKEEAYRGAIRRIEQRFQRRERRSERDFVDRVLLAASAILRDRIVAAAGGGPELYLNPDLEPDPAIRPSWAAAALGAIEEARAALAEDLNLNTRLVLERAFILLSADAA
jgi:hypothetical protein